MAKKAKAPQKTTPQTTGLGSPNPAAIKIASAMLMGGLAGAIPKSGPLQAERGSDVTAKRKGKGR